jgi:hypothetical protein
MHHVLCVIITSNVSRVMRNSNIKCITWRVMWKSSYKWNFCFPWTYIQQHLQLKFFVEMIKYDMIIKQYERNVYKLNSKIWDKIDLPYLVPNLYQLWTAARIELYINKLDMLFLENRWNLRSLISVHNYI